MGKKAVQDSVRCCCRVKSKNCNAGHSGVTKEMSAASSTKRKCADTMFIDLNEGTNCENDRPA